MRESDFRRTFQSAALAATIAIAGMTAPAVAAAQGTSDPRVAQTTTTDDDGQDWGWIGLLGLAGLLGLRRREPDHVHPTDTTRRP